MITRERGPRLAIARRRWGHYHPSAGTIPKELPIMDAPSCWLPVRAWSTVHAQWPRINASCGAAGSRSVSPASARASAWREQ